MNETDPLANLKDIHLPPPVEAWPPAPGWWLLGLALAVAFVLLVVWLFRRWRKGAWRRQALAELPAPAGHSKREIAYYAQLNRLLKRAARVCYPGAGTDRMSGDTWEAFLTGKAPKLPADELRALARAPYQREAGLSPAAAHQLAQRWLRSQTC